jgi:hypothetical protein
MAIENIETSRRVGRHHAERLGRRLYVDCLPVTVKD